jgi:hypothetical protein
MALNVNYAPVDPAFGAPFVDIDEQRQYPRPHRFVHGGFEGTQTLFSFYFPDSGNYDGRFVHFVEGGMGGNEVSLATTQDGPSVSMWAFLYDLTFDDMAGYLVESNQGYRRFAGEFAERAVLPWQASAESARFSRHVAAQVYDRAPHHGYVGGMGGGGMAAMACFENAPDVYDGCTPQVMPSPEATPWTAQARAQLFIGAEKMRDVIDAMEPGGSGDPYTTLNATQREALADMYRAGYPRGAENQLSPFKHLAFGYVAVEALDPSYFEDFWKVEGYAGADNPGKFAPYLINRRAVVQRVLPIVEVMEPATFAWYATLSPDLPFGLELDVDDPHALYGANIVVTSGEATGRDLLINSTARGISALSERTPEMMQGVRPGDDVEIDNRNWIAFVHYFLYTARASKLLRELTGREVLRSRRPFTTDGHFVHPQRPDVTPIGPMSGGLKGEFAGKMVAIISTKDVFTWPVQIEFREIYAARYGDSLADRFRFYWAENGAISPPQMAVGFNVGGGDLRVWDTRLIDFQHSMGRQAWSYLRAWVEDGVAPPASTASEFSPENALLFPASAQERAGIQPVVHLTVSGGGKRAEVGVGENVSFEGTIEAPPGAGGIVVAEWDFDHTAEYRLKDAQADGTVTSIRVEAEHVFDTPGTWFVALRGGIHPAGLDGAGMPVHNLDRVRVVVS